MSMHRLSARLSASAACRGPVRSGRHSGATPGPSSREQALQLVPGFSGKTHCELQRADGTGVDGIADPPDLGTAVLRQRLLDDTIEPAQLTASAAQDDVLQHALLQLRIESANQIPQSLQDRGHDGPA